MSSGYVPCACRDCMDVAISSDDRPALCLLCKDAGCIRYEELPDFMKSYGVSFECQRLDAYTEGEDQCSDE